MLTFMARLGQVDRKDSNSLENKCTLDANTCELKIGSAACSWKTVSFRPTTTTMTIPGPFQALYPKKQSVIPNKKQSNIVMTHAWSMFLVPVSSKYRPYCVTMCNPTLGISRFPLIQLPQHCESNKSIPLFLELIIF